MDNYAKTWNGRPVSEEIAWTIKQHLKRGVVEKILFDNHRIEILVYCDPQTDAHVASHFRLVIAQDAMDHEEYSRTTTISRNCFKWFIDPFDIDKAVVDLFTKLATN